MGYYSFYRIIKDIIHNFKKNKLLVIVAIIILILFICNKVFAINFDSNIQINNNNQFTFDNITYTISEQRMNSYFLFLVTKYGSNGRELRQYVSDKPFSINYTTYNSFNVQFSSNYYFASTSGLNLNEPNFFYNNFTLTTPSGSTTIYIDTADVTNYVTNFDIKNNNGDVIIQQSPIDKFPKITTSIEDLETLNFDTISVSANGWSDKDLYILFYDRTLMNNQNTEGLYPKKEIKLSKDTSFYIPEISTEKNAIYWVANDNTGLNFKVGGKYEIRLAERVPQSTGRWLSWRRLI